MQNLCELCHEKADNAWQKALPGDLEELGLAPTVRENAIFGLRTLLRNGRFETFEDKHKAGMLSRAGLSEFPDDFSELYIRTKVEYQAKQQEHNELWTAEVMEKLGGFDGAKAFFARCYLSTAPEHAPLGIVAYQEALTLPDAGSQKSLESQNHSLAKTI